MPLLRSNVEFAHRVFLDRLTADQQPMSQPDIDAGPGDEYDYGGVGDPYNLGVGFDCSGLCGCVVGAAMRGPAYMEWTRQFTTETFPGGFQGFRQTTQDDLVNNYYVIKVVIHHGGGGPNSHMACSIDGIVMESNGDSGVCTLGHGAMSQDDPYWNDFWVLDEPIAENTPYRCPMTYPQGLDYTSPISGKSLVAAGKSFVCRYVTPGGDLQWKCLLPDEFADLVANGIAVVFNYESTKDRMLDGYDAGMADAQVALDYIRSLPGVPAGYWPTVYFSCDFDESADQDGAVEDYCRGAGVALSGWRYVGIYGSYGICRRALDADVVGHIWQTEAWSKGDLDSRVDIVQRNAVGYQYVDGIQCDIDEAHTEDFGQYKGVVMAEDVAGQILDQLAGKVLPDGTRGWPQLGNRSMVDFLAQVVGPGLLQIQTTLTSIQSKPTPAPAPKKKGWLGATPDD